MGVGGWVLCKALAAQLPETLHLEAQVGWQILEMVSTCETRKEETHKRGGHGEALIFVLKGKRDFRCHVSFDLKVDIYNIYIYVVRS